MTIRVVILAGCLILTASVVLPPSPMSANPRSTSDPSGQTRLTPRHRAAIRPQTEAELGHVWFEPNVGRHEAQVRFVARVGGQTALLTGRGATFPFAVSGSRHPEAVRMELIGSNPAPLVAGVDRLPGTSNYLFGRDRSRWHRAVSHYAKVHSEEVYPGIDLVFHAGHGLLEFDFIVGAGARPESIAFAVTGADRVALDVTGAVVASTPSGDIRIKAPEVFQEVDGVRRRIPGRFEMTTSNGVSFRIGAYDVNLPLTIDPQVEHSLSFGGSNSDTVTGITVDAAGAAYVVGTTNSTDFDTLEPVDGTLDGSSDAFVAKILPDGSGLSYATYLGGSGADGGLGIAVDATGVATIAGSTRSTDFPTTAGAFQTQTDGNDAYIVKLAPDGSSLRYGTYLGGGDVDNVGAVTLDARGRVLVVGSTGSSDFPTMNTFAGNRLGPSDAFITVFNEAGSGLDYSTFFGGSGFEAAAAVALGETGDVFITGFTTSGGEDFPASPGALLTSAGGGFDAFVAKFDVTATGPQSRSYATFYGGLQPDFGNGIGVDSDGNAYIGGSTSSNNIPRTAGSFQPEYNGGQGDGFLAILNATGTALLYGTYIGGSGNDAGLGLRVSGDGDVVVVGNTDSPNLPQTAPLQPSYGGGPNDAFVFYKDGASLLPAVCSYLGGSGAELGFAVAFGPSGGTAFLGFTTKSRDFPGAQLEARIDPFLFDEAVVAEVTLAGCKVGCPEDIFCTVKGKDMTAKVAYHDPSQTGCDAVVCKPRKGSDFAVGTTDVKCEGGNASGQTDSCTFKIHVFEKSAQDDTDATRKVLFNTSNGKFVVFCGNKTYTGMATVTKLGGGEVTLTETTATQKFSLTLKKKDDGTKGKKADMSFEAPPGTVVCTITDSSLKDSRQACPTE